MADENLPGDLTRRSIDQTDAQTEIFECVATSGAAGTASSIGRVLDLVHKPAPGEIATIGAALGRRHVINFNTSAARIRVEGGDLILFFTDGGRIVFENLAALAPLENAPVFVIADNEVPGGALFGAALAPAEGKDRPEAVATLETAAGALGSLGNGATQSGDDTGESQDIIDVNDILIGPEGILTVPSDSALILDTHDDAGGEFLPDTLVTDSDFYIDLPTQRTSWPKSPLTQSGLNSGPLP